MSPASPPPLSPPRSAPPRPSLQYGAFTPCIFYALLGSSRQLVSAPEALAARRACHAPRIACCMRVCSCIRCTRVEAGALPPRPLHPLPAAPAQAVGPVAVTSLILGTGLSDIYGKFAVNPSDPENALIGYKQHQYNVGAIQVAFIAGDGSY